MNQNDINRMFTEKVTELISQGYQINPATMSGSQGEYAHVDLRKGTEIIRVLLDDASDFKETDNPKYAFRCFLLRLGFIGAEYKRERAILLQNLEGNGAFKSGSDPRKNPA